MALSLFLNWPGPTTDPNGITCVIANSSDSDEVGKSYERYPDCDKKNGVGNEIREDHEDQPAD
jgi:hypothetical protein